MQVLRHNWHLGNHDPGHPAFAQVVARAQEWAHLDVVDGVLGPPTVQALLAKCDEPPPKKDITLRRRTMVAPHLAEEAEQALKERRARQREEKKAKRRRREPGPGEPPFESAVQHQLATLLDEDPRFDGFWFHPPNGGMRQRAVAKRMAGEGVKPGVPDVMICRPCMLLDGRALPTLSEILDKGDQRWLKGIKPGHLFTGCAIELKRAAFTRQSGHAYKPYPSKHQRAWIARLREAGWWASVARGLDQALQIIDALYPPADDPLQIPPPGQRPTLDELRALIDEHGMRWSWGQLSRRTGWSISRLRKALR